MSDGLEDASVYLPSMDTEIDRFIGQISSLAETLDPAMFMIDGIRKNLDKVNNKFENEKAKNVDETEDHKKFILDMESFYQWRRLQSRRQKYYVANRLIPRSFLISLVSQFDIFLGRLIRTLSVVQPKSLDISEKHITFLDLEKFGSIENARESFIEKEIDRVLRGSHTEMFEWFEKNYQFGKEGLRKGLTIWPIFIEATERRNLFVHTDGVVSHQYINVCRENKVILSKDCHIGSSLEVTREYFRSVYECIFYMGVGLAHVLWRKVLSYDLGAADANLNRICYDLLAGEEFDLAASLLEFAAEELKNHSSDNAKRMFVINQCQAYKWSKKIDKARDKINSYDWSASSDKFKLAHAVLIDDFDTANKLIRNMGKSGGVIKEEYREWPLFRELRKTEGFQKVFYEIFGEPLYPALTEVTEDKRISLRGFQDTASSEDEIGEN